MKPSTEAAVRLHRNAVRDRPESLSAFKWNACPPSPEYPDREHEGELDTGRRHPIVLRWNQPAMAGPLPGTSDRRPTHHPPDPEMVEGGHLGRRGRDGQ